MLNLYTEQKSPSDSIQKELPKSNSSYLNVLKVSKSEILQYESLSDIKFQEVDSVTNNPNVIVINTSKDASLEVVENKLHDYLKRHNWWLEDYWREKGLPKEQFTVCTKFGNIEIYNFSELLTEKHIEALERTIQLFSKFKDQRHLQKPKYILIDNLQKSNPNTGEPNNGIGVNEDGVIELFPNTLKLTPHRISEVSNWEGSLIHELSHGFSQDLINSWQKAFNWNLIEPPIQLPGGDFTNYQNSTPEKCITEYAKIRPAEDLCDSMVAATKAPEKLDPERLAFIREKILQDIESEIDVTVIKRERITLPHIEQPVKYLRKESFKIISRS